MPKRMSLHILVLAAAHRREGAEIDGHALSEIPRPLLGLRLERRPHGLQKSALPVVRALRAVVPEVRQRPKVAESCERT